MNAVVAFGANLGDPCVAFQDVAASLARLPAVSNVRSSCLYRTEPVGGPTGQPPYINGAYELETSLEPPELHLCLLDLQHQYGRRPAEPSAPRALDLDLVLFGDREVRSNALLVPHPRMHYRWFVLRPIVDVAPKALHPLLRLNVSDLLHRVESQTPTFVLVGGDEDQTRPVAIQLARRLPQASSCRCPLSARDVHFLQVGRSVVGVGFSSSRPNGSPNQNAWAIVLRSKETTVAEEPSSWVAPAVDCRGDDSLAHCERFLDSLKPGKIAH